MINQIVYKSKRYKKTEVKQKKIKFLQNEKYVPHKTPTMNSDSKASRVSVHVIGKKI